MSVDLRLDNNLIASVAGIPCCSFIYLQSEGAATIDNLQFADFSQNQLPTVTLTPNTTTLNQGDTFTATGSSTDPDSTSWTATVNYGDGSGVQPLQLSGMTFALSHVYSKLGTFTLTVQVTDNQGATGSATVLLTIIPVHGVKGANLSGTNYSGADLSNQNISGSNLQNGTFTNVTFQGSNLSGDNAPNASFQNANFTNANLAGSTFQGSNFTGANFTGSNLKGANLKNASMTGVIWSNTMCPDGTNSNTHNNTCSGHGGGL